MSIVVVFLLNFMNICCSVYDEEESWWKYVNVWRGMDYSIIVEVERGVKLEMSCGDGFV